jgi:hypothetical protein
MEHPHVLAVRVNVMDELGLTERVLIEKHLVPPLSATIAKFFQHEERMKQKGEIADNDARPKALAMAFKLRGSYSGADPKLAEPACTSVIVIDVPRPHRPGNPGSER